MENPLRRTLAVAAAALAAAAFLAPAALAQAPRAAIKKVVIDPGHGGSEKGAEGPDGLLEKDLTLDVSKRLADLLRADGFEVVLAREADVDVPLDARAALANTLRADLFVSVHVNASRFAAAHGAETYFLARESTDDAARTTAALENDAAGAASAAPKDDGDLSLILWDMAQVEYLKESERLAATIQNRLNETLKLADRGVRQAPFRVLVGATCPAVLVELGFISNKDEAKQLASEEHRKKLAEAVAAAIKQFRAETAARTK
ncbi:N-acetylmuramoyl-L-alanine amidase [bacterium]|nr:N-acetylmuramoyl-L-alanine amidase [bacterium]